MIIKTIYLLLNLTMLLKIFLQKLLNSHIQIIYFKIIHKLKYLYSTIALLLHI